MRPFKLTSSSNQPMYIPSTSWSPAWLPGSECDPTYDNGFLDGPNGGLEGSVETVLFRIDKAADVNIGDVFTSRSPMFTSRNHVRLICCVSCVYVYLE